jgi:hypothetical protein
MFVARVIAHPASRCVGRGRAEEKSRVLFEAASRYRALLK